MMLVDSHCHLQYEGLVERQEDVLETARARGVGAFLNISTRASEWQDVIATAHARSGVWASIGVHPHNADDHADLVLADLVAATRDGRVIGIGETGLDYYYDHSDRGQQQTLFRMHIAAAQETGLPLIIHTREAEDDTLAILAETLAERPFAALIHCFTATTEFGRRVLDLGLSISLSGIVTFKNAAALQAFAREIPAARLLVETDSPFLAPVPHRGKTCEPGFVKDTAAFLARLRGESEDELARYTTDNFFRLFSKAARE